MSDTSSPVPKPDASAPADVLADARASLGELRDAVDRYVSSLGEELTSGGSIARKLADDAAAAQSELNKLADTLAETGEADSLHRADIIYPVLSRTMLLVGGVATAAADFDERFGLQTTATSAVSGAYDRASMAIEAAQELTSAAVSSASEAAASASAYARVPDVMEAARASLAAAEQQVRAVLDAAPEGGVIGSARDGLSAAAEQLASARAAWGEGGGAGLADASRAAISRAREAVASLAAPAAGAVGAGMAAARVRADAALLSAREHVTLAGRRLAPAAEEAAELSAEGLERFGRAAAVLAEAGEDVVVGLAASADDATGLSERVGAVAEALELRSAGGAVVSAASALAEAEAVRTTLGRLEAADEAQCGGCGSRTARGAWAVAAAAWGYALYLAGRVADEKAKGAAGGEKAAAASKRGGTRAAKGKGSDGGKSRRHRAAKAGGSEAGKR